MNSIWMCENGFTLRSECELFASNNNIPASSTWVHYQFYYVMFNWNTFFFLLFFFFFSFGIKGFYIPQRYVLTFMGFLGLVMAYSMRLSLSVAITQMVPPPILNMANLTTANGDSYTICPFSDENYINEHFDYQAIFDQLYSVI